MNALRNVIGDVTKEVTNKRESISVQFKPEYDTYTLTLQIILSLAVILVTTLYCLHRYHRNRDLPKPGKNSKGGGEKKEEEEVDKEEEESRSAEDDDGPKKLDEHADKHPMKRISVEEIPGDNTIEESDEDILWKQYEALVNSADTRWQLIDVEPPKVFRRPKEFHQGDDDGDSKKDVEDKTECDVKKVKDVIPDGVATSSSQACPPLCDSMLSTLDRKKSSTSLHSEASSKGSVSRNNSPLRNRTRSRPTSANRKPFVVYCSNANKKSNTCKLSQAPLSVNRRALANAHGIVEIRSGKRARTKSPEKSQAESNSPEPMVTSTVIGDGLGDQTQ